MADQLRLFEHAHTAPIVECDVVVDALEAADRGDFVLCQGLAFWLGPAGLEVVDVPGDIEEASRG